jgi:pimeloyl-ACP methyl ester carboxylesterase
VLQDQELARIRQPVLGIWGERDERFQPIAQARRRAASLPRATFRVVEGRHEPWFERPEECGRLATRSSSLRIGGKGGIQAPKPRRSSRDMTELKLAAGTIDYEDTGGDGPVVMLLHGVVMNGTLWRHVVADLSSDHRCVVPNLPLGAHRLPMRDDADLSLRGQARLVAELLQRLDLSDLTLVCNDWGGPLLLMSAGRNERIGRLVLAACETFDNYPPGLPGRNLGLLGRAPGGLALAAQALRVRALRRLPLTLGWMSKRPVPDEIVDGWLRPLRDPAIRRDLRKYVSAVRAAKRELLAATEELAEFDRPVLVVWGPEDRVMPIEHGRRLAEMLPRGRLVEIPDTYTLIPEDQPALLAAQIREFVANHGAR